MTENTETRWLNTQEAADYLTARHSLPTAASTLTRKRTEGDGPLYSRHGRKPIYATSDLDAYVAALPRFGVTVDEELHRQNKASSS
ncbi:hypothetical protein [Falsiruegeria litorea]|uniref:hypothetical protein n=1 Tax=Falsiruegeria litorea TaxID=1280831 RepID=UPI001BFE04ED|nr:hypothetical protein [Falsiruegeria litorea]MBT8169660.1 hypothetical protein [Falsiruegeria litorea]